MKRFIETLKNIWKIEELRKRILLTLSLLLVYRLGSYVVLPGIDPVKLQELDGKGGGALQGILDLFAGGAFSRASIFALGIMPYISASIAIQLLTMAVPAFQKMQKDGEAGRNKLNQYTRYLTILITLVQAVGFVINLKSPQFLGAVVYQNAGSFDLSFWVSTISILVAGTMFTMWLGEKITDKGIGQGISLIIMVGIAARLPQALISEVGSRLGATGGSGGLIMLILELIIWLGVIIGTVALVQAVRKIPLQVPKRQIGSKQVQSARSFIPLKVNAAGVMPIIFAQAIMYLPAVAAQFFPKSETMTSIGTKFSDPTDFVHNLILAALIIVFTFFYTSLSVPASQMADDLKRSGAYVPGVQPGEETANFIDEILSKITFPGALMLAVVAILPSIARIVDVNSNFAQFFGGTSLLILVGVVLDTLQQVESYLLSQHYDGLIKGGRVKGRRDSVEEPI